MAAGNRRERRAAAKSNGTKPSMAKTSATDTTFEPTTEIDDSGVEYILKHPDFSGPKGKTLFQLADERQRELRGEPPLEDTGNTPPGERPFNDEEPIGPFGDAILYSISLATLHLTLDVIVYSQYREEVLWSEVFQRAGTALPIFFLIVYLTHVDFSNGFPLLRNIFFFVISAVAGCYFVYTANVYGYFFVMKAAPPVGSLWIWSVVEMSLPFAAANAVTVLGYLLWNGFDAF
ncbi:hypothetical protein BDV96DRAFT_497250 [Lophiotrema nucula]|uniref:DUF7719 domain-containing protein n=1 Tax=Lophiotrema nucula TaxID=690887 RepID=A0A6A5Z3N7_9PLEO|nr:hypothetical protein BDV96DRAFT_497250 [Lophiotrema nucula]